VYTVFDICFVLPANFSGVTFERSLLLLEQDFWTRKGSPSATNDVLVVLVAVLFVVVIRFSKIPYARIIAVIKLHTDIYDHISHPSTGSDFKVNF